MKQVLFAIVLVLVGQSAAAPMVRVGMSKKEVSAMCDSFTVVSSSDDSGECSKECGKLYYNKDLYDYEKFMTCYRCCFSGGQCIPPRENAPACSGKGTCVSVLGSQTGVKSSSRCKCDPQYTGDYCERKLTECPTWGLERLTCNNQGECSSATGTCQCRKGYSGDACEKKNCPVANGSECSGQSCNPRTGTCVCGDLFKGDACEQRACPRNSNNLECSGTAGVCQDTGKCLCASNFKGEACQTQACPRAGPNNEECGGDSFGTCGAGGKCACRLGFKGPSCQEVMCPLERDRECGGPDQGTCVNGQCQCKQGLWKGRACEVKACPFMGDIECAGRGFCSAQGKCQCDKMFKGLDCSEPKCPTDIYGNECSKTQGVCKSGTCACTRAWKGPACDIRACPINVDNNLECGGPDSGACNLDGTCVCKDGFKGVACQTKKCPVSRSGNQECGGSAFGECNNGQCRCKDGFTGTACELIVCPKDPQGNVCGGLNGICNGATGVCTCQPGYRGSACEKTICPTSKVNGRECYSTKNTCQDNGKCSCQDGWRGITCDDKICPLATLGSSVGATGLECNGPAAGACSGGIDAVCKCKPSYRGLNCGVYYVAKYGGSIFPPADKLPLTLANWFNKPITAEGSVVTIRADAGEIFEATLTCNAWAIDRKGNGISDAGAYVSIQAGGAKPLADPNVAVARETGSPSPLTTVGLYTATTTGDIQFSAAYWSDERPSSPDNSGAVIQSCSLTVVRVNSGVAAAVTNDNLNDPAKRKFDTTSVVKVDDVNLSMTLKSGDVVRQLVACELNAAPGSTTWLRAAVAGGVATSENLAAMNVYMSSASTTPADTTRWASGLSQEVVTATTDGSVTLSAVLNTGTASGGYGACTNLATVINGTWAGVTSTSTFDLTWSTHVIPPSPSKTEANADFFTTINVQANDAVRAVMTCNIIGDGKFSDGSVFIRVLQTSGVASTTVVPGVAGSGSSKQEWKPITSVTIVRATVAGALTFGAKYFSTVSTTTFVYCSIYAENLGFDFERASS